LQIPLFIAIGRTDASEQALGIRFELSAIERGAEAEGQPSRRCCWHPEIYVVRCENGDDNGHESAGTMSVALKRRGDARHDAPPCATPCASGTGEPTAEIEPRVNDTYLEAGGGCPSPGLARSRCAIAPPEIDFGEAFDLLPRLVLSAAENLQAIAARPSGSQPADDEARQNKTPSLVCASVQERVRNAEPEKNHCSADKRIRAVGAFGSARRLRLAQNLSRPVSRSFAIPTVAPVFVSRPREFAGGRIYGM
jgi:hypothetical protein